MRSIIFLIVIFNIIFNNVHTARILGLFHFPSKSHQMVFDSLMKKLADRDHEITVATFFPLETRPNNYTEINLKSLASLKLDTVHMGVYEFPSWYMRIPVIGSIIDQYEQLITLEHSALSICQKLTKFTPLNDALKKQYDVVIIETLNDGCVLGLLDAYGINVPIIGISSSVRLPEDTRRMGADNNPSYVPIVTTPFTHKMSFLERLENVIMAAIFKLHYQDFRNKERAIIENHFGKAIKDINDMEISLMFVNTFPVFNGVYPIVPGIIEIGGIHIQPDTKMLPKFIQKFINESEYGVIIFSFGSQISSTSLSKHKQDMFLNAFAKLKQRVLWKYTDSPDEGTLIGKNVLQVRWLPQFELLRHPKIKAIIYHGGLLGLTEAISAGKPVLVIPIFVDQRLNAAAVKAAGVGEILSLRDIQAYDIDRALKSVLSEKYVEILPFKNLIQNIEKFVNESEHGIILFSLGTQLSSTSISKQKRDVFIKSFSKMNERVLWKYADSADEGTLVANNILQVKWLPQNELLKHPKVKAFIGHGGMLGSLEAISAGKPMIVIPIFADQKLNAAALNAIGVAEILSLSSLNEKFLDIALENVLSESMRKRALRVSEMWHDRESQPLDTAVYWTERVIRWGNESPLYSQAKYLSFYQYTLLDIAAFLAVCMMSIVGIFSYILIHVCKLLRTNINDVTAKNKLN